MVIIFTVTEEIGNAEREVHWFGMKRAGFERDRIRFLLNDSTVLFLTGSEMW